MSKTATESACMTIHASEAFKPCNRNTIPCPGPGVYSSEVYSMEDYHKIDAVNSSTIKAFIKSGVHGKLYLEGEQSPPSPAMLFGTAAHARIFEREDYDKRAIDGKHPKDKGKTLADTCVWSKHKLVQDENPDSIILHEGWAERIEAIARQIESNPDTHALFTHPDSLREVTLIWHEEIKIGDTIYIVPFKARLDMFNPVAQVIPDLKTTMLGGAAPDKAQRTMMDFGYHISAGVYVRGCLQLGLMQRDENGRIPDGAYIALFAETKAPFIATPYAMRTEAYEQGWEEAWALGLNRLMKYRLLGEAGNPEYTLVKAEDSRPAVTIESNKLQDLDLPEWARNDDAGNTIQL